MEAQISKDQLQTFASKTFSKFHSLNIPFVSQSEAEPVSVDVGYGGVKVFSMKGIHSFPSLLFRIRKDNLMMDSDTDIKYKDEYGNLWYIGDRARDSLETGSRQIDGDEFYSNKRLMTDEYLILMRVAIYLGLCDENYRFSLKNKHVRLCTGLPEEDVEKYSGQLRKAIAGHHYFQISVGGREWQKVNFDIDSDDIEILSQPMGTIYSMAFDLYGNIPRADLITDKNVLVLDGGMFTFDTYLSNRADQGTSKTWEDFAMYEVHLKVRDIIHENTGRYINEFDIEKYIIDKDHPCTIRYKGNQRYYFGDDYLETVRLMSQQLARKLKRTYDEFNDIDVVIATGGTGMVYYPYLKEMLSVDELLLAESKGGELGEFDAVFSNVVGFFKFLTYLIKMEEAEGEVTVSAVEEIQTDNPLDETSDEN